MTTVDGATIRAWATPFVRWLLFMTILCSGSVTLADRVLDERVNAAFLRLELREDQKEPFTKILEDYYSSRKVMLRREAGRAESADELVRKVRNKLKGISERTLKDMGKVLDEKQMVDAESLLHAADGAFIADVRGG